MIYAFFIANFLLVLLPLWALRGWRIKRHRANARIHLKVSVIVPFRNEEARILPLLTSLENVRYNDFEILLVNDHSADSGPQLVEKWCDSVSNARLLSLPAGLQGKKAALTYAISQAQGDVILTSDADCRVGADWITAMAREFRDPRIMLSAGLVAPALNSGFIPRFSGYDMAALTGISVGSLRQGYPTMCNGANLAFRRDAFLKVDGYTGNETIPSGDDEFLLHKIAQQFPGGTTYTTSQSAVVFTQNAANVPEFIGQRIRWISKWRAGSGKSWFAPVLVLAYLLFLTGWGWVVFQPPVILLLYSSLTLFKMGSDFLLIRKVMNCWGRRPDLIFFLLAELVYPFYVILFGLLAMRRQYVWKGRRYEEALA